MRGGLFRRQEGAGGSEALPAPHLLSATASRGCHFRASHPPRRPAIHLCLSQDEFLPLELLDDRQPLLRGSPLAARSLPLPANAGILATRGTSFQASAAGRVRQQPTHPASLTICHSSAAVCQSVSRQARVLPVSLPWDTPLDPPKGERGHVTRWPTRPRSPPAGRSPAAPGAGPSACATELFAGRT